MRKIKSELENTIEYLQETIEACYGSENPIKAKWGQDAFEELNEIKKTQASNGLIII